MPTSTPPACSPPTTPPTRTPRAGGACGPAGAVGVLALLDLGQAAAEIEGAGDAVQRLDFERDGAGRERPDVCHQRRADATAVGVVVDVERMKVVVGPVEGREPEDPLAVDGDIDLLFAGFLAELGLLIAQLEPGERAPHDAVVEVGAGLELVRPGAADAKLTPAWSSLRRPWRPAEGLPSGSDAGGWCGRRPQTQPGTPWRRTTRPPSRRRPARPYARRGSCL